MKIRAFWSILVWVCVIVMSGPETCPAADAEISADVPRTMQLVTLPDGELLALTTEKGGLYMSEAGGRKWKRVSGTPDVFIHHVAVLPDGSIHLATAEGLLRLKDHGGEWEQVLQGSMARMHVSPDGSGVLLKAWGKGVTAQSATELSPDAVRRATEAADRKQALQAQEGELVRRMGEKSGGDNATLDEQRQRARTYGQWQELQGQIQAAEADMRQPFPATPGGLADMPVTSASMAPDGAWLAGTFGFGIHRFSAAGGAWEPFSSGLASRWVLTMATAPWGTVYAGTYGAGIFALHPAKTAWEPVDPVFSGTTVQDIAFGTSGQCVAATRGHGLIVSLDQGNTWSERIDALPGMSVQSVAVAGDGSLWAGTWDKGLYVSSDMGASWDYRPFADEFHVADLAFAADGMGYAVLAGHGLFRTLDHGRQWIRLKMPVRPSKELRLAIDAERVFLGSPVDGLWVSTDKGESWVKDMQGLSEKGVLDVALAPSGTVLAIPSEASGLYERLATGEWRLVPVVGEEGLDYSVWDMIFLPDGRALAFGHQDLLLSGDGGKTWERKHFGQPFKALAVDSKGTIHTRRLLSTFTLRPGADAWEETSEMPLDAYVFFRPVRPGVWVGARQDSGVDVLAVQGANFEVMEGGLVDKRIAALGVAGDGAVFAGFDEGLMVSRDDGLTWQSVEVPGE
jgi:ligand-binding sensor domain-containing protein